MGMMLAVVQVSKPVNGFFVPAHVFFHIHHSHHHAYLFLDPLFGGGRDGGCGNRCCPPPAAIILTLTRRLSGYRNRDQWF